jgi:hypothetical protein
MDHEIAEQLARRDRLRKKLAAGETYSERMQKMAELQEATWKPLQASPTGWAHFLRRNFRARAIDVTSLNRPAPTLSHVVSAAERTMRE